MSQRTPSHCSAMSPSVAMAASRSGADIGSSWTTSRPGRGDGVVRRGRRCSGRAHRRARLLGEVVLAPAHEVLGVVDGPGGVGRHVVGHEVQQQAQASRRERGARRGESGGATEPRVHVVAADAVRRADDVVVGQIRQRGGGRRPQRRIGQRQCAACRAPFPDTHQPDGVDAGEHHGVRGVLGTLGERDGPALLGRERREPGRGRVPRRSTRCAVARDQGVRRASRARARSSPVELGDDPLGERLAELDAPLVEGVDAPDDALREDGVLVERDERAEHAPASAARPAARSRAGCPRTCGAGRASRACPRPRPPRRVLPNASASACAKTLATSRSW